MKEKAALARVLIEELDTSVDANVEQLWIDEALRRHDAYLKGELEALPGDDVMNRARSRVAATCL
ncbi:MAG: putative addiction module component [Blastocatellia bacterium]|nr:putative addiction module component [Blastocatellia bacterium]